MGPLPPVTFSDDGGSSNGRHELFQKIRVPRDQRPEGTKARPLPNRITLGHKKRS